jgi:putative protease
VKIEAVENEFGAVFGRNGHWFVRFDKLVAENGREWESVHSGNVNPITLPGALPPYSFLRIPAEGIDQSPPV